MVNNLNITPPSSDNPSDAERLIDGPLYELEEVKRIIRENNRLYLVTKKCKRDVANLGWENNDVADLVLMLEQQNFKNSEWCNTDVKRWMPCDAYAIQVTEPIKGLLRRIEYYVKYSIGPDNTVLFIVSCHL